MSFRMKVSLKVLHSFLKVFLDLEITMLINLRYHPSVKVPPLPLLILLRKTSTTFFLSL